MKKTMKNKTVGKRQMNRLIRKEINANVSALIPSVSDNSNCTTNECTSEYVCSTDSQFEKLLENNQTSFRDELKEWYLMEILKLYLMEIKKLKEEMVKLQGTKHS